MALERGDISLLYVPRVERPRPRGLEDVQRFLLLLAPHGRTLCRLLLIGHKRLPDATQRGRERYWGFVARVGSMEDLARGELDPHTYRTRTRGERFQPGARRAGEGEYRILRHRDHTHLEYHLLVPRAPGDVQRDLHVEPSASYIIAVKNPVRRPPPGTDAPEPLDPALPPELMARFRDRRYAPADPPDFLDHEGLELMLIAAGDETIGTDAESAADDHDHEDVHDHDHAAAVGPASREWED